MNSEFSKILKKKRYEMGISQETLAKKLFVTKAAVSNWENGNRIPDTDMVIKIAKCLDIDISVLMSDGNETPNVIIVDDDRIILKGSIPIIKSVIPNASVIGFTHPSKAIEYAKNNKVALAFLDIELGNTSGLELCSTLLEINPRTNVVFVTAYSNYSLDAWGTRAVGFILKPITAESVSEMVKRLRYPLKGVIE
ncbi:MAG: response regulator [Aeriscardovia sp.]|nr:response regulator [Aeriscardovia sp.]